MMLVRVGPPRCLLVPATRAATANALSAYETDLDLHLETLQLYASRCLVVTRLHDILNTVFLAEQKSRVLEPLAFDEYSAILPF
jgi:hypothetical protein